MSQGKQTIVLEPNAQGKPGWFLANVAITLFTLSAVCLCVTLAVWQWQRAEAADLRFVLQTDNSVTVLDTLPIDPEQYQRVKIEGVVEAVYFLDNRSNEHRAGREVLVELRGQSYAEPYDSVLVNLGWQNRSAGLSLEYELPEIISIEGILKIPSKGFELQDPQLDPNWPKLMQHVNFPLLSNNQSRSYYPAVIYSVESTSGWSLPTVKIENKYAMHIGYSVQWLLLAAVFVFLFIKLALSRDKNENR